MPENLNKKVIVIGAGIAGMATAARLAATGYNVILFEKNNYPGGKLSLLLQDGYTFDTGPSLFTQPYIPEALFKDCGKQLSDYLSYDKLDVNTHYFYEDGTSLIAYQNHQQLQEELEKKLNTSPVATLKLLTAAKNAYENIGTIFLNEPIHKLKTWFTPRIAKALKSLKWNYLFQSMHQYHISKLKDDKLVQLFDRLATYNGSNPYTAPAMLSMIAHLEMNEGAYYPKGGMISITNALYTLCKDLGVRFKFNSSVEKILTNKNVVTGVNVNGVQEKANIVVSNSDVYFTYNNLLNDKAKATQLAKQERSSSALIFYWGIKKTFPQLHLHNIFFSNDYRGEFDSIFKTKTIFSDPTVYVNITSKMEAAHAPAQCENWFVLVNTYATSTISKKDIDSIRTHTINKLNRILQTDISELIETESVLTPWMIERRTGSYMGALYGTASNNPMAAFKRHPNGSRKYKGLYFAGGTVHPGGGIPLCLRSARLVADAIANY